MKKVPHAYDDGLICNEVGLWAERKYRLVQNYAKMFSTSMKGKWDCRVYLDLFSGPGFSKVKDTSAIVCTSPFLALSVSNPFDKYIFCESDSAKVEALGERVRREFPDADVSIINADVNEDIDRIIDALPKSREGFKVLTFCFVDPCNLENLKFETIKKLSKFYMDFMVLIPTGMDAHRNLDIYLEPDSTRIKDFTGVDNWRNLWKDYSQGEFGNYVADIFSESMAQLGYMKCGVRDMVSVKNSKNITIYHLAFYSRDQKVAQKFWKEAKKYSTDQATLF